MSKQEELANRMVKHQLGSFDGGYSSTGLDHALIDEAVAEANEGNEYPSSEVVLMAFLASQYAETSQAIENARNFMIDYIDSCMVVNFGETDNEKANNAYFNG